MAKKSRVDGRDIYYRLSKSRTEAVPADPQLKEGNPSSPSDSSLLASSLGSVQSIFSALAGKSEGELCSFYQNLTLRRY